LPKQSSALLLTYLREIRPRISSSLSSWLFPNAGGAMRNIIGFGAQLSHLIDRHAGLKMHPHLFRHMAVKFVLLANPDALETARRLLGHKSIATTLRVYSEGKNAVAQKHYEDLIETMRHGVTPNYFIQKGDNK
jgi:integrase